MNKKFPFVNFFQKGFCGNISSFLFTFRFFCFSEKIKKRENERSTKFSHPRSHCVFKVYAPYFPTGPGDGQDICNVKFTGNKKVFSSF
jgi:hypothetical protein